MNLSFTPDPLLGVDITDASAIARMIDDLSWSEFRQVPFAAWLLTARGEEVDLVNDFVWKHQMLAVRLYNRLLRCREKKQIKDRLLEVASGTNPFARSVLVSGTQRPETCDLNISFIIEPLSCLARPTCCSIEDQSKILEVRYQRTYHLQRNFDAAEFRTDISFFCAIMNPMVSLVRLANIITLEDLGDFHEVFLLAAGDKVKLKRAWNYRCEEVVECLQVHPELFDVLVKLALRLSELRNFHASTAIAQGLKTAGYDEKRIPWELYRIIEYKNNYQLYRDELGSEPALPFLFPLLKDLQHWKWACAQRKPGSSEYKSCTNGMISSFRELYLFVQYIVPAEEEVALEQTEGGGVLEQIRKVLKPWLCF